MLRVRSLNSFYGRIQALKNVSLHVNEGEIVALIGANGAGKTTVLNSISGLIERVEGEILFRGRPIQGERTSEIVRAGITQVSEGRPIFKPLTVRENLELGAFLRYRRENKKRINRDIEEICDLFPILRERGKQMAGTLSGGEQQMLLIARALLAKPSLLLLDEPSMGLAPMIIKEILEVIARLNREGTTILMVEQNARAALNIAHRGYVLETGRIILEGSAQQLAADREVQRAYLGGDLKRRHSGVAGAEE